MSLCLAVVMPGRAFIGADRRRVIKFWRWRYGIRDSAQKLCALPGPMVVGATGNLQMVNFMHECARWHAEHFQGAPEERFESLAALLDAKVPEAVRAPWKAAAGLIAACSGIRKELGVVLVGWDVKAQLFRGAGWGETSDYKRLEQPLLHLGGAQAFCCGKVLSQADYAALFAMIRGGLDPGEAILRTMRAMACIDQDLGRDPEICCLERPGGNHAIN